MEAGRRDDAARRRRLSRVARHGAGLELRAPGRRRRGLPRTRGSGELPRSARRAGAFL